MAHRHSLRFENDPRVWQTSRVYVNDGTAVLIYDSVPVLGDGGVGPFEEPGRVFRGQVDAAVTAHLTEVIVPVGAVERVALVKVLNERHVAQVVGVALVFVPVHG